MLRSHHLSVPLAEKTVRELKVGDTVYLDGIVYQLRIPAHKRALEYAKAGKQVPFDLKRAVIYHVYTSVLTTDEGSLRLNFLGSTTSALLNKIEPEFIRTFKPGGIIGKGGMDKACLEAMAEVGCVYLAQVGGASAWYSSMVEGVNGVYWEDMGFEMVLALKFKEFGPLIVGMDACGGSLYEQVQLQLKSKLPNLYELLSSEQIK